MTKTGIETVCGYSCSDCDHHGNDCNGCGNTRGKPFWTIYAGIEMCPIYECCVNERLLPHCGVCPEMICERFTRFRDPGMSEEEARDVLHKMEAELRQRSMR